MLLRARPPAGSRAGDRTEEVDVAFVRVDVCEDEPAGAARLDAEGSVRPARRDHRVADARAHRLGTDVELDLALENEVALVAVACAAAA